MKFERESWRKLYVAESAEHRLLSVFARGLRDYLLRLAGDEGTILASTEKPKADLQHLLGARPAERRQIEAAYDDLIKIGYLSHEGGRLWITKFVDAQTARSPGAKRQATYKANKEAREAERQRGASPSASPGSVSGDATGDAPVTSQIDETRRDEIPPAPAAPSLAERARRILENPHDGAFQRPSVWPEVILAGEALGFGMDVKFTDHPGRDADLRAVLEIYAAGYTPEQVSSIGEKARGDAYFKGQRRPGPASFTPAVVRRMVADQGKPNDGYGSEGWAV